MKAVIQRVSRCAITADGQFGGHIEKGLLILLGVGQKDERVDADYLVEKCLGLRIFADENDKMNRSVWDVKGSVMIVSNFTLYGDCRKGKRPNFMAAGTPAQAEALYEYFVSCCRDSGIPVVTGVFGADMKIEIQADGPVTILLDIDERKRS